MRKKVITGVLFENFFFNPHFNEGTHKGTFNLCAIVAETGEYFTTSEIEDVRETEEAVIIETKDAIYTLFGRKIQSLEDVKRYLHNENFTSEVFFNNCVPNKIPTRKGWELF